MFQTSSRSKLPKRKRSSEVRQHSGSVPPGPSRGFRYIGGETGAEQPKVYVFGFRSAELHGTLEFYYLYEGNSDRPSWCLRLDDNLGFFMPTVYAV